MERIWISTVRRPCRQEYVHIEVHEWGEIAFWVILLDVGNCLLLSRIVLKLLKSNILKIIYGHLLFLTFVKMKTVHNYFTFLLFVPWHFLIHGSRKYCLFLGERCVGNHSENTEISEQDAKNFETSSLRELALTSLK